MPGTFLVVSELEGALLSWRWHWNQGETKGNVNSKVHSDEVGSEFENDFRL